MRDSKPSFLTSTGTRYLQVVPHYLPTQSFGGVLQAAHSLGKALQRQGCPVRVCTTNMQSHTQNMDVVVDQPVDVDGLPVVYARVGQRSYLRRWGFSWDLPFNIWRELAWADVAILHFHYQFATWIGALLCRLRRKPYLIYTHGSLNRLAIHSSGARRKTLYLKWLEKGNFRKALYVVYLSEEEMEESLQLGRAIVVPNGIEPQDFAVRVPAGLLKSAYPQLDGKFVFLYLGRLDPNKGLDVLLPAFDRLRIQYPHSHLLLAGPDERGYRRHLEEIISRLGLDQSVTFTGYLAGDLRLAALQQCQAYVLPSRYEGLSMSLLEALYNGLPVIITPHVGLWRRLQAEDCALIADLDEGQLFSRMEFILRNPDGAHAMGQRAHRLVAQDYNWDAIAVSLLDRLRPFLSDKPAQQPM